MRWEKYRDLITEKGNLPENYYILGIDLGTTNSVISYWDNAAKKPEAIDLSNGFGKIPMPSVVQFRKDAYTGESEWVIGEEAYRSMKIYPGTTVRSIKRLMGTSEKVVLGKDSYKPEEISAKILLELVQHCYNLNPKAEIVGLVVSVPYDFDDAAKKATLHACELAGLSDSLICLIEEPKAAALAYNFRHSLNKGEKIMVFDFGGGTLDITIFHVVDKDESRIKLQVISEGGEAAHGGDNIDDIITEECYRIIQEKTGQLKENIDIENQADLIIKSRETKERLSGVKSFRIPFTFCVPPFVEQFTRDRLNELIQGFISKTKDLALGALHDAYAGAILPDEIDRVLLEGGSSQMPWIRDTLVEIFNDESKIYSSDRPALDISLGAAYYAAMKMGLLSDPDIVSEGPMVEFEVVVPHDIGLEVVTPLGLQFFTLIKRGTPYVLAKKSRTFTLSGDTLEDMTTFKLKVLERIDKDDTIEKCKLIGEFDVKGLPERPSGKTKLKITLSVTEEGGLVAGSVEDMGFGEEFEPSGIKDLLRSESKWDT
ncbi:MAG: Hsp70 family protein [Defluviitaleaceae bacterium]|nr:Hsp70 family protein [Defluviitaleaceae bacterium]